jgi:Ni/Co efflux regulator RcnB
MIIKKVLPQVAFVAFCLLGTLANAAEQPSVTIDRPGAGLKELKKGDNLPDQYQRESLALKDWQNRHLSAPGKDEQWVEVFDKYALVNIPTGTILQMINKSDAGR